MTADKLIFNADICAAFRRGLAQACGPHALENLLAVLEGKASLYTISGTDTALDFQCSVDGETLWINALSGKVANGWEAKRLLNALAEREYCKQIRCQAADERLAAIYQRLGFVPAEAGQLVYAVQEGM